MKREAKKEYLKPEIEKHKPVAVVAGSGSSCGSYASRVSGGSYYH